MDSDNYDSESSKGESAVSLKKIEEEGGLASELSTPGGGTLIGSGPVLVAGTGGLGGGGGGGGGAGENLGIKVKGTKKREEDDGSIPNMNSQGQVARISISNLNSNDVVNSNFVASLKRREGKDFTKNGNHRKSFFLTDADFEPPFLTKLNEIRKLFELSINNVGKKKLSLL